MIHKFLVYISRFLEASKGYKKTKSFFYNLLENDHYKYKKFFDYFMIIIVLSSVFVLLYDVKNQLGEILYIYDIYVVTTIFVVEYLLRFWIYNDVHKIILDEEEKSIFLGKEFETKKVLKEIYQKKLEYIISPFAIIDLLAILPAYRPLRILRIFMLFRLFKVLRYTKSVNNFLSIIKTKKFEILTLLILVGFITFIGGAVIYVFEYHKNPNIHNFFDALYWSLVTISTVGYGDISPVTNEGRVLTMFLILAGIGFISFATSIIASAFAEKLQELKTQRIENEAHNLKEYYLICGYSDITELLAKKFQTERERFIIVDLEDDKIKKATELGFLALKSDITKTETLDLFKFENIKKIFILTNNDIINTFLILSLKDYINRQNINIDIIAIVNDERNEVKLSKAGAKYVLNPTKVSALFTSEYIYNPVSFEIITAIFNEKDNISVDEIEVIENSFLDEILLGDIDFGKYQITLIGVAKQNEAKLYNHILKIQKRYFYFNPEPEINLEKNDILLVVGDVRRINHFKFEIEKSAL